jgi:hypothetical protein
MRKKALVPGAQTAGSWGWTYEGEDGPHARTCAARARSTLDRPAREWRSALSAEYGYPVRARLLPRNTGCANLERASRRVMIGGNQKAGTLMTGSSNSMAAIQFCGTNPG